MTDVNFSTKRVNQQLIDEIVQSLKHVSGYGSVEIFINNFKVTQITVRDIKKTDHTISKPSTFA